MFNQSTPTNHGHDRRFRSTTTTTTTTITNDMISPKTPLFGTVVESESDDDSSSNSSSSSSNNNSGTPDNDIDNHSDSEQHDIRNQQFQYHMDKSAAIDRAEKALVMSRSFKSSHNTPSPTTPVAASSPQTPSPQPPIVLTVEPPVNRSPHAVSFRRQRRSTVADIPTKSSPSLLGSSAHSPSSPSPIQLMSPSPSPLHLQQTRSTASSIKPRFQASPQTPSPVTAQSEEVKTTTEKKQEKNRKNNVRIVVNIDDDKNSKEKGNDENEKIQEDTSSLSASNYNVELLSSNEQTKKGRAFRRKSKSFFSKTNPYSPLEDKQQHTNFENDVSGSSGIKRLNRLSYLDVEPSSRRSSDSDDLRKEVMSRVYGSKVNPKQQNDIAPNSGNKQGSPLLHQLHNHKHSATTPNLFRKRSSSLTIRLAVTPEKNENEKNALPRKMSRRGTVTKLKPHFVPVPMEHSDTDDTYDDIDECTDTEINMYPLKMEQVLNPLEFSQEIATYSTNVNNLKDLHPILLNYIMSFMMLDELARFGATNRAIYEASKNDVLWANELLRNGFFKLVYNSPMEHSDMTVRERFQRYIYDNELAEANRRRTMSSFKQIHTIQLFIQWLYGFFSPVLVTIGLGLFVILLTIYLEGILSSTRVNILLISAPFIILTCPGLCCLLLGSLVDTLVLNRYKQQYFIQALEHGYSNYEKSAHKFDYIQFSEDRILKPMIHILLWSVSIVPITAFFALVKQVIFPSLGYYSIMIPIVPYCVTLVIALGPITLLVPHWSQSMTETIRGIREDLKSSLTYALIFVYLTCCVFNMLFCVQIGLVCAKLDQFGMQNIKWRVTFLPSYLLMVLSCVASSLSVLFSLRIARDHRKSCTNISLLVSSVIVPSLVLPALTTVIFLGLKLDGLWKTRSYFLIFLPVILSSLVLVVAGSFGISGCCFFYKYKRYQAAHEARLSLYHPDNMSTDIPPRPS